MTAAQTLSQYVLDMRYEHVPADVRRMAVRQIIDNVGIGLASQSMPFARIVTDILTDWGGPPESTIYGSPVRVPAANAVIANGNMIAGIDFDNTHGEAMSHPGACIAPTALALAEKTGTNGRDLVLAVVADH